MLLVRVFYLCALLVSFASAVLLGEEGVEDYSREDLPAATKADFQVENAFSQKNLFHGWQFHSNIKDPEQIVTGARSYQTYLTTSLEVYGGGSATFFQMVNGEETHEYIDDFVPLSPNIPLQRQYDSEEAVSICCEHIGCPGCSCLTTAPRKKLVILPNNYINSGSPRRNLLDTMGHLAHKIELDRSNGKADDAYPVCMVDAYTGDVLMTWDEKKRAVGSSLFNGIVNISTSFNRGYNFLEDKNRTHTVLNCQNGASCNDSFRFFDADNLWNNTDQRAAVQVAWGLSKVYDYLLYSFGRVGLDGSGGPFTMISADGSQTLFSQAVNYGDNLAAAIWDGDNILYGNGDNTSLPWTALDIVAHESAHGIIQFTSALNYIGESGALAESFGDILAAVVDRYVFNETEKTWKFGEDIWTPSISGDAIRYINNPRLGYNPINTPNPDPDHVSMMYNGAGDNYGIHINCGIPNKVFYLLANGGAHPNGGPTMSGVGVDAATAIWYRAYTVYMSSTTDFLGARVAYFQAARDLYGLQSSATLAVQIAWGLCGVGSIPTPNPTECLSNTGFETTGSWNFIGVDAVQHISYGSSPHSGTGYAQLGIQNSKSGSITQTFHIPSTATTSTLTFWLWVVTFEKQYTTGTDKMFVELRNADNGLYLTQLAMYTNVNANVSLPYIQKGSFNLMPFINVTNIRVEFRVTLDFQNPTYFFIDDVSIANTVY